MKNYPEKRSLTILGLIFLLLVLGIAGAGYLSYRNFEEQFRIQVEGQLTAIANLKETELLNWRNERLAAEAEMLRRNFDFAFHTQHYFENPDDVLVQRQLQTSLQSFRALKEYDRVSLLDLTGQVRLTDSGGVVPLSVAVIEQIPAVLQSKQVTMVDFYHDEADQNIYLSILIPIMDTQTGQQVIGLVALRINPHIHIYPYLQQWPMPSTSAETLLVRREGDEVLFLNNLRFKPDAALTLRFPLEQTERPAVKAALGQTGIVEGLGYYDESVLTDVRAVPDTPWFLVAKIDIAEAYAPLRERAWATLMFYGMLILAIGAGMVLVWWQQYLRYYRQVEEVLSKKNHELQEMVGQLEQSRAMLQLVIESIPIRVFWKDKELRYLGCNSMFARDAGLSQPQQLLGKDDFAMGWKEQAELYRADDRLVMASGHPKFNIVEPQTTPAGTTIWLNTSKVPLQNPDGEITGILGIYEDITERKQAEEALRQSEERHRIIAELATDDVYVGWLFPDGRIESEWMTGAIERITGYSPEEIKAWPNNLASIVVEQDLDKVMELRPRLLRYESVAVEVRIRCKNGDVRWLSNQIKPMPDKTREPAVRLLSAVQDITERKQAEEALRQNEELYRTLVEALDVSLSRWLPDTTLVFANEKYRRVFGFQNRMAGQKWVDSMPEAVREETAAFYRDLARNPHPISYERSVTTSDGIEHYYQWIDTPILDARGRAAVFQSVGFDLTERKHTEQLVQAQRDLARIIGTVTSAEDAWPLCLETVLWVSGMDSGGIYLFDGAGSALELVYQQGLGADFIRAASRYPINTPSAQMVLAGVPLYFSAADLNQIHHQTEGLYALATIPIQYQGEVLGCFNIASHSLAQVPDFARHALEIIAPEIGNIIMYLRTASLLRESEEKYRSLVDSQDAVIATVDADGVYHYMNPIGAVPLASSPEAVVGRNLRDFFPSPSAEWQLSGIRQVITTGQGLVSEYQTTLMDQPIWRRVSIQPVRNAAGQVTLAMVNSVDITERKRLETALRQSEERYRIISGAVTDYAFSTRVNENGEFVMDWVAGAFEEITGYTFEEFVARGGWQASLHPDDLYIDNHIREELVSNRSAVGEMRIFSKTGQIVHLRLYARPVWAERENKLKAIYGAVQNITERKQAEHALRESEERLRQITSSLREVIWLRDAQTRQVLYVNPAFEELTGWTCENFYENRDILADSIYPDDRERMIKALEQRSESILFYQEHRLIHRDGSIRWVSSRSFPVRDTAGMVYRWVTNMEDITERKKAEDALRAEQQRFTQVAATVPGVITTFLLRPDGTLCIPYASPAFEDIYGLTLADVAENINPLTEKVPPEQVARLVEAVGESARTLQPWRCEYQYRHPLKGDIWLEGYSMPIREADGSTIWHGITTDITERKQAEAELQRLDKRYRALIENAPDGIVLVSEAGKFKYISPSTERLFGYLSDEDLNLEPAELTHPDDQLRVIAALVDLIQNPSQRPTLEYRFLHKNGEWRWVQSTFSNLLAVPNVEAIVINFKDITERKQAEEAQQESEERFRTLYETMMQGIVYHDAEGSIIAANPAAERILGLTLDQMQGRTSIDPRWRAIHEDGTDFPGEAHPVMVALRSGEPVHNVVMGVFHPQIEQYVWISINAAPQFKPGQAKPYQVYALFEDITARKLNEDLVLARLRLIEFSATHTVKELLQATLDEAGLLVSSPIGFYHFVDPDQNTLTLQAWSTRTRKEFCTASGEDSHYSVDLAGVWADSLRQRRPIIHNDYATLEDRRGLPVGHAEVVREAVVPIMRGDRVVAIMGIGNKPTTYTLADLEIINTFADMSWDIVERKRAEQELQELTHTLEERVKQRTAEVQDLYDNAPTGYHSLDKNGVFVLMNQTELNWLGYTREEVVGIKSFRDLVTSPSQQLFATIFPLLKNQGWVKDLEFDMVRKDGSILPVLLNATAIYDSEGNYLHSRTTIFDNTERKEAETALRESEEQNRLLFEESPDAVVLFDEVGQVVEVNHAFEQLTGYTRGQLAGYTLDELGLLSSEQAARLAGTIMQAFQQNNHFQTVELKLQHANKETRDAGARIFGVQIRGRQHYLTTMRDITTEKQAEKTLRLANAELGRAARAKDEFLANMSHELRTPLNAILGFSEALLEQVRGPLNERQQASVRNIEASGRHLLALISDILDLSKVEAGRLELLVESVPVADVCQASLLFVKETALKKQLQLAFHLNNQLAKVQADPKRFKQMLVNLLSNAVKFTPEGGQVSLEVTADAEAGVIRFAVQDSGIGITPEGLARLFQPFMQLDSSLSRQYEGTGLGLALVRRLAELHGGSVTVESDGVPGQGSRFTIALPYHPSPARDTGPAASETEHTAVRRPLHSVLVVEDSKSAAEQLARYLQEANVHVVVHPQGEGALDQAIHLQPDVIFLDLLMPDQSGWEVLAQLKSDSRTRHIPVIIVSVMDEPGKGLAAGATVYLVKPISREIIQRALDAVAARSESVREALVIVPKVEPAGARILLAEDNEINIEAFEDYLEGQGYQVVVARNGREAVSLAVETRPELILMDIQMPELDGLEATRQLRSRADFATTPIIALTALAMPGDRERCLDAGANEYLTKPIKLKSLVEIIEKLLWQ